MPTHPTLRYSDFEAAGSMLHGETNNRLWESLHTMQRGLGVSQLGNSQMPFLKNPQQQQQQQPTFAFSSCSSEYSRCSSLTAATSRSVHYQDREIVRAAQELMTIVAILGDRDVLSPWEMGKVEMFHIDFNISNTFLHLFSADMLECLDLILHLDPSNKEFNHDVLLLGQSFCKSALLASTNNINSATSETTTTTTAATTSYSQAFVHAHILQVKPSSAKLIAMETQAQINAQATLNAMDFFTTLHDVYVKKGGKSARKLVKILKGGWWQRGVSIQDLALRC